MSLVHYRVFSDTQATNEGINAVQAASQSDNIVDATRTLSPMEAGNRFHYDHLNGGEGVGGPTQLQQRYPDTQFRFAPRGSSGPDVAYQGGPHPSSYPNSSWPQEFNYGDFKPNTPSGLRTFYNDLNSGKLPSDTVPLPYNRLEFKLLDDYNFGPE